MLIIADMIIIGGSYILSLLILGFNGISDKIIISNILLSVFIYFVFLCLFRMYQNLIYYEIGKDYLKYIICSFLSMIILTVFGKIFGIVYLDYLRINALSAVLIAGGFITYRLIVKEINFLKNGDPHTLKGEPTSNLLIVGAGLGGREMIITIKNLTKKRYNIVGLVDDDKSKYKKKIVGVEVLGNRYDIPRIVDEHDVDYIFLAISRIDAVNRRKILELCGETKAKVKVWPTTEDVINKQGAINSLRDVEIEDLLGRAPIKLENHNISNLIKNKVVLVTGGGGSIGSEICRQIITYNPRQLVILDIYENNLYDIEMELKGLYPDKNIDAVVASVRDIERMEDVFKKYHPNIVLHAAAHKHVPLMENSPLEAIHNNIFGTYNTAILADKYKVSKFVLISTDKAVNPTNIMGATKRFCELIIQAKDKKSHTDYCAVRFGNVLGSNGSVIPLFRKQIEAGGPVTVTSAEINRFFMTIPEACGLVIESGAYAEGGEKFILDMGEPVKIIDLAKNMIKLSGLELGKDIDIEITGLRPGEKLYEELLLKTANATKTQNDKIYVEKGIHPFDLEKINEIIDHLVEIGHDNKAVLEYLQELEIIKRG